MRAPASLVAIPLLVGSGCGLLLHEGEPSLPLCAAAGAVLAWIAALGLLSSGDDRGVACAIATGCLLAGVSLGATGARRAYHPSLLAWFDGRLAAERDEPALVEGVLREDAALTDYGASLTIDVDRVLERDVPRAAPGGVRLSVGGAGAPAVIDAWRAGRRVRVAALLRRPTTYRNPGLPDEVRALARRGVVLVGAVKSAALVEVIAPGGLADETAAAARRWARSGLAAHVGRFSARSGAITAAILIGDRTGLSEDDQRRLQEAGTYHVIAISGGNIAILTAILLVVWRAAGVPPRVAALLSISTLLFYGQLTGAGASVARAVTAAVIYLAGRMLEHRGPPLNALAVAAALALCASPLAAFDAGFILSFGATLGILLGAPRLWMWSGRLRGDRRTRVIGGLVRASIALLAATICAEVALAAAGAAIFSRITFAGLFLNFAAIPLMTIVQAASMAVLALAPVSSRAADAFGFAAHLAAEGLVGSARLVDYAPWLSQNVPPPAWWLVAAYYSSAIMLLARGRRVRAGAAALVVLAAALMLVCPSCAARDTVPARPPNALRVIFLDVGQGDATLVATPDGRMLLVDTAGTAGPSFNIGERVLAPSLRAFGITRLATLVVTHADPDHVGGAPAIMRRFRPGAVWDGVPVPRDEAMRALAASADARLIPWRTLQTGDRERYGGLEVQVLHPPPPEWERQKVRNNDSVVLEVRTGDVSVLLAGDIEREAEHDLLARLALAPTVVLKAPHHGSATSSTQDFIRAAGASAVIVSAGTNNRFGHPAPAVVARYAAAGVPLFRTDRDGAVIVDTDGKTVEIWTWGTRRRLRLSRVAR